MTAKPAQPTNAPSPCAVISAYHAVVVDAADARLAPAEDHAEQAGGARGSRSSAIR